MTLLEFDVPAPLGRQAKTIPFLGLNDYISAERSSGVYAASLKRKYTNHVAQYARLAANLQGWVQPSCKVYVTTCYHELNKRRDFDNIVAADKFVLDGLVQAGVIKNDSQKWLAEPPKHKVDVDPKRVGVTVIIETEN